MALIKLKEALTGKDKLVNPDRIDVVASAAFGKRSKITMAGGTTFLVKDTVAQVYRKQAATKRK